MSALLFFFFFFGSSACASAGASIALNSTAGISSGGGSSDSARSAAATTSVLFFRVRFFGSSARSAAMSTSFSSAMKPFTTTARRPTIIRIGFHRSVTAISSDVASTQAIHAPTCPKPETSSPVKIAPHIPVSEFQKDNSGENESPSATGNRRTTPAKKIIHDRSFSASSRPNKRSECTTGTRGVNTAAGQPNSQTSGSTITRPTRPTVPVASNPERAVEIPTATRAAARKSPKRRSEMALSSALSSTDRVGLSPPFAGASSERPGFARSPFGRRGDEIGTSGGAIFGDADINRSSAECGNRRRSPARQRDAARIVAENQTGRETSKSRVDLSTTRGYQPEM